MEQRTIDPGGDEEGEGRGKEESWQWSLMVLQPEFVTDQVFSQAVALMQRRKGSPSLSKLRLQEFWEGLSAQILHVGPYAAQGPTVARLNSFMEEHGYLPSGRHHEIYLSDPRRTSPDKLKTIIRQPIQTNR